MTLIRSPFKKRTTIAGTSAEDSKQSSTNGTPKSLRSNKRSDSVTSSVNSLFEDDDGENGKQVDLKCSKVTNLCVDVCEAINNSSKNIYAEIDENNDIVESNKEIPPSIPDVPNNSPENPSPLKILQVSMINEYSDFEEVVEVSDDFDLNSASNFNSSKNNLLQMEERPIMMSSIDCHLDDIDKINKNLDKILEAHHQSTIESHGKTDEKGNLEVAHDRTKFKDKLADKLKILKESRLVHVSSDDLKNRIKKMNVFSKFEKQNSQDDSANDNSPETEDVTDETGNAAKPKKRALKLSKSIFSSFREKKRDTESGDTNPTPPVEQEEEFEEVSNNFSKSIDLDDGENSAESIGEPSTSKKTHKIKKKFQKNLHKLNKKWSKTKLFSKKSSDVCSKCSKRKNSVQGNKMHLSKAVSDFNKEFHTETIFDENDLCVCVVEDDTDDGEVLSIKKHDPIVSVSIFSMAFRECCY